MAAKSSPETVKVYATIVLITIIGVLAVAFFVFASYNGYQSVSYRSGQQPIIVNVSGTGTVSISPDTVYASIYVTSNNTSANVSQNLNSVKVSAVMNALEGIGILPSQIQTTYYTVQPLQVWKNNSYVNVGYQASEGILVTSPDVGMAAGIAQAAISAGGNGTSISNIYFGASNSSQQVAQSSAIGLALGDAMSKAQAIASATGTRVGRPVTISEYYPSSRIFYYPNAVAGLSSSAAIPPQISPGNVTVTAQVTVEYSLN